MALLRLARKCVTTISPEFSNKIMYKVMMKKRLNLKNPKTFNEKINYLKLYVYPYDEKVIQCADKYVVRNYLKEKNLSKYLVKLIGCWDNVNEIEWEKLPNKFVLKCNHGCGYNIICTDKNTFNIKKAEKQLKKWMNEDFGKVSGEPHYSKIKRKIICEKFLEEDIKDYKFFCFKGNPEFFYISQNINGDFHNMQADFFYTNGKKTGFERTDHRHFETIPKMPKQLNEMIELSKRLSKDFDFVRVDLYNIHGKIYFSELTFTPCSGFMRLYPENADKIIGDKLQITMIKKVEK